jgi:uncharacterized membrane protein YvbJ
MKCVRCGADTRRKSSFCKDCEDFIRNDGKITSEEVGDREEENVTINWGYMMVTFSVIAVAAMIAFIVFCYK